MKLFLSSHTLLIASFFSSNFPSFRAIPRAMFFSIYLPAGLPGSSPPWPASSTTTNGCDCEKETLAMARHRAKLKTKPRFNFCIIFCFYRNSHFPTKKLVFRKKLISIKPITFQLYRSSLSLPLLSLSLLS